MTESDSDWCSFSTCDSNRAENLKFFSFPVHRPDLCHKWLDNCQNEKLRNLPLWLLQHHTVCELHFDKTCITEVKGRASLSKNAVPASADPPEKILNVSTTFEQRDNDSPNTTVNEMDSLDSACFVCDKTITSDKWKYKLKTTATKKRKVPVSDLIQLLVGDDFEVLVGERDAVCSDCMKSLNDMDALTDQLANVKVGLSRLLNLKYNLTSDDPELQVEFESSDFEDSETFLNCDKCDFQTEKEKELNEHMKTHTATRKQFSYDHSRSFSKFSEIGYELTPPNKKLNHASVKPTKDFNGKAIYRDSLGKSKSISDKKENTNTASSKRPKGKASRTAFKGREKKVKFVFQCSVCDLICKTRSGVTKHAKKKHGVKKKVVVNYSQEEEGEYADIQTLDDQVSNSEDNSSKNPVKHKLDFLDDWDEEEEENNPSKMLELDNGNASRLKEAEKGSSLVKHTETAQNLTSKILEHDEENEDQEDEDYNGNASKPTCMFCHSTFFSLEAVKDHVKLIHGDRSSGLNLDLSRQTENDIGTDSDFNIRKSSNKQKRLVPIKKMYKCNFCGIRKLSFQLIQMHRNQHKRQIALQCKFCGAKLKKVSSFKTHRLKCRKVVSALKKCKHCQFKFFRVNDLMKHEKNVHFSQLKGKIANDTKLSLSKISAARNRKRLEDIETSKAQLRSRTKLIKEKSHKNKYKCDSCDSFFFNASHLLDHKITHKVQQCLKFGICIWCSKIFGDKPQIEIHTEKAHEEWLAKKSCSLCSDRVFYSKREFKFHFLKEHFPENTQLVLKQMSEYKSDSGGNEAFSKVMKELQDITGEGSDIDENTFRPNYCCPLCDFQGKDEREVQNHQTAHKNNYCNICQSLFKIRTLSTHANYHSREFLGEKCTFCKQLFHDDIHLISHLQRDHPDCKNKCNMCTQSFTTLTDLVQHKCITHGVNLQKVMTCKVCEMKFLTKNSFRNHKEFAHRQSPSCKFCDKAFPSFKSLLIHEKKHLTQHKKYKCSTCGKVLKTMSALKTHKVKHLSDNLQSCETCGKTFKTIFFMREHLASHSKDHQKRYHCSICGRGFYFYDTHCRHRKVHLDPFLYSCQLCKTRFQNNALLKTHSKTCREKPKKNMILRKSTNKK